MVDRGDQKYENAKECACRERSSVFKMLNSGSEEDGNSIAGNVLV